MVVAVKVFHVSFHSNDNMLNSIEIQELHIEQQLSCVNTDI